MADPTEPKQFLVTRASKLPWIVQLDLLMQSSRWFPSIKITAGYSIRHIELGYTINALPKPYSHQIVVDKTPVEVFLDSHNILNGVSEQQEQPKSKTHLHAGEILR